ncbi:MAG: hypothetical protein ACOY3I_09620 [Verrucomicrobiota bacterium]
MQIGQRLLQIFSYGRHAFIFVGVTAGMAALCSHAESNIAEQAILDREQYLITKINQVPEEISAKEKHLISDEPLSKIFEPQKNTSPTTSERSAFRYAPSRSFRSNPLTEQSVTLPQMPDVLSPFGAPVKKVTPKSPPPASVTRPQSLIDEAEHARELERQKQNQPIVALSPFLSWVQENQEQAKELARRAAQKYAQKPVSIKADDSGGDPFLSIRFPYRGIEPSPQGSAAIYSTPEK